MKRIHGSQDFPQTLRNTAVTLGNYDGVHIGHRRIIERVQKEAKTHGGVAVVYTFNPHPVRVLAPEQCPPQLQTLDQRLASLEAAGVDICVVEEFTPQFASQVPEIFFEGILQGRLHAKTIVVGYDFTFGLHRQGNTDTLANFGASKDIEVIVTEPQFEGETLISSTNIRHTITRGDIKLANRLLGHDYEIEGTVVLGRGIGTKLGINTANINPLNELLPADGVYVTGTLLQGEEKYRPSITSIGKRPTFPDSPHAVETHLIDASISLLGKKVTTRFLDRIREQITFNSAEELRQRITHDIEVARNYHS